MKGRHEYDNLSGTAWDTGLNPVFYPHLIPPSPGSAAFLGSAVLWDQGSQYVDSPFVNQGHIYIYCCI